MGLWQCMLLGGAGGALVEALDVLAYVRAWQRARRTPTGRIKQSPPKVRAYVDVPAHAWLLVFRVPLGAGAAWLFATAGQISGPAAALALGVTAPAVLAQVGRFQGEQQTTLADTQQELLPRPVTPTGTEADRSEGGDQP